ncbi:Tc toxin subunit A [Pseudomonas sp. NR3]|uniref:Tc toxin subunit A n=1 Tax=Pseudomonas sp. NR3 TaxID=3155978 RepID=UPI003B67F810
MAKAVLGNDRVATLTGLAQFIEQSPSVFDLIQLRPAQLQALGLSGEEAQVLLARGKALAVYVARYFRERAASGIQPRSDEKSLVPLPTYMNLFNPDIKGSAPAGAIENRASTTAYMVALREWVAQIERNGPENPPLPLALRRPDVDELLINEMAVDRRLSRLEIANTVLEAQIRSKLNITDVRAYLRTCRFHNSLPYDHDWESITHVVSTALKDGSLGDVIRFVDLDYPYFKNPGAKGQRADAAQQLSIGIGPLQLSLLLESPYFKLHPDPDLTGRPMRVDPRTRLIDSSPERSAADFYKENFGDLAVLLVSLRQLRIFSQSTRLDQRGVDALLGNHAFTPQLSANAPAMVDDPDIPLTGADAGAVYVHGGEPPAIEVLPDGNPQGTFQLHHVGETDSEQLVLAHRMDRINRKCRLDRMLGLPSHQVDRLLVAAMRAEYRGTANAEIWIRPNTLRCLGLFKELSIRYGCQAEEFAAFIDVLSVHGQDGQLSQFDRVYNRHVMYDDPLLIDDGEFSIAPRSESDEQTVHQICRALDINFETYRFLALVIAGAYGLRTQLRRDLKTLSSFWRLTHLARLVGLTPIEATALLQTMSDGEGLVALLAGEPVVTLHGVEDGADVLSAIQGLMECALWAKEYELPVLWLVRYVNPVHVPAVWTEGQEQFLRQLRNQVLAVRVQEATLLEEGAPLRDTNQQIIEWLPRLKTKALVDDEGLVIGRHDETEAQYLARTREAVREMIDEAFSSMPEVEKEVLQDLIVNILLRCRDEQRSVVEEGVSVFLKLDSLLAAQIMRWAEGHVYDFLAKAMELSKLQSPLAVRQQSPEPFLKMLAELERRSQIAVKLGLSPQMLDTLLTGEQYQWFSLEGRYEITLQTVYYLALYNRIISRVPEPEEKMLDYLRQVNELPDDMSEDGLRLVRDAAADKLATYLGCGIKHVLECVQHIQAQLGENDMAIKPILSNLAQLDLLLRTLELAKTGMDATAAFSMGSLDPLDSDAAFAAAARNALESLTQFNSGAGAPDSAEVGQSITTRCLVDNPKLIANLPQEVAEFECTLLDFYGEPLKGVIVYWHTDLGAILTPETRTDEQGRAKAELQSGGRMGTAHVSFNIPLHDPIYGPSVVIDCDEDTLGVNPRTQWPQPGTPVSPILAGLRGEQEFRVRMYDSYRNPGAFRKVEWFTSLGQIRPNETYTDKDGWSRVWLSSMDAGEARVSVFRENGSGFTFEYKPEFVDRPRILDNPYVISAALIGQPLTVGCLVVTLGDEPADGQEVTWWTSLDPADKTVQPSDEKGVSVYTLPDAPAGELTVFAQMAGALEVELAVWVASDAVIYGHSRDTQHSIVGGKPRLLWVDVKEETDDLARPLANYPVEWTLVADSSEGTVLQTRSISTDAQGRSPYEFHPDTEGDFTLTARLSLHQQQVQEFKWTVLEAFEWTVHLITLLGDDEEREEIELPLGELTLFRNSHYRLEILAVDVQKLVGSNGAIGWSSDYTSQALAMEFTPRLATSIPFEPDEPLTVEIKTGDVRNGRFQLSLVCDRLTEALVLNGTLSRRPSSSDEEPIQWN